MAKEKTDGRTKLSNGARGASEYKPIDLKLPEGEWWRPWEDGDETIELTIKKVKSGQYGDYLVGLDGEGLVWFVNLHAMLDALRTMIGRTVRIEYLGFDQNQGRNGVHQYAASQVQRARNPRGRNAGPAETPGGAG